jgi:hypothetical protein
MRPLEVKAKTSSPPPRACDRLRMPSLEPPDLASHRCKSSWSTPFDPPTTQNSRT